MNERALLTQTLRDNLQQLGEVIVAPTPAQLQTATVALGHGDRPLTRDDIREATRLVLVTHVGTAVHIDVDAATAAGIVVLSNPGFNADSVAEHTIGLLIAVVKNIPRSDRIVRSGEPWEVGAPDTRGYELRGKTLALIGYGNVGSRVARIAAGVGMHVVVWALNSSDAKDDGYDVVADLDEALTRADVVSVHLALTPQTRGLLDEARLAKLPRGAFLINTAQADVLDYAALNSLLRQGHLAGAGIDTWPSHRPDPTSPLLELPQVVFTQHNAGLTYEAAVRMSEAVVCGIESVLAGDQPRLSRLVNPQVWAHRNSHVQPNRQSDTDTTHRP